MKKNPSSPDSLHLHSLFYKLILKIFFKNKKSVLSNSLCGIIILIISSFPSIYAVSVVGKFDKVFSAVFVSIFVYIIFYVSLLYSLKKLELGKR